MTRSYHKSLEHSQEADYRIFEAEENIFLGHNRLALLPILIQHKPGNVESHHQQDKHQGHV